MRPLPRIPLLVVLALLAAMPTASAQAAAPSAPPEVLAAPAGTVDETMPVTFRIRAAASDQQVGRWALLIGSGNDEAVELKPTNDPAVYERTFRLRNQKVFAGERDKDATVDFAAPETSSRIFPGAVTWSVVFFPASKHSYTGDRRTATADQTFEFKPTFERRRQIAVPSLPQTSSRTILPNKSIAGLALGDSRKRVVKRWGKPFVSDESLFERTDIWSKGALANGEPRMSGDFAQAEYDQEDVDLLMLERPSKHPGGLAKLKTPKGIGLGSPRRALLRAYPNIGQLEDEDDSSEGFVLQGRSAETVFGLDRHHRVNLILLRNAI